MNLGLSEIRRTPGRFAAIAGAVGFIVFLALILAALSDGLYLGSTGAYRTTPAQYWVFSPTSGLELSRSTIDGAKLEQVAATDGVETAGRLSVFNTTATSEGQDLQLSLLGADANTMPVEIIEGRLPEPEALEVVVDSQVTRKGIGIGSLITPTNGPDLEVVGVAGDAGFGFTTAWAQHDTFLEVRVSVRPELGALEGTSQALGITTDGTTADRIAEATGLSVATPQEAIDALPGASQQKITLNGIVYTTFVVAAIVVGLFFALVTLEKRNEYAVLKAIGMPNRKLVAAIFVQALIASAVGYVFGLALSRVVGLLLPSTVPALFLGETAIALLGVALFMGSLGAIFSFRRVTRIDPANALGGPA